MIDCVDHGCKGFGLGYATAWIIVDGRKFTTTKHRKVFYEQTGEWPEVVRHTCDNPRCINPGHLIGGTHAENMQDMVQRGRQGPVRGNAGRNGIDNRNAKLTDADCVWIRAHYVKGSRTFVLPSIARKFKCGTSQIHRIIKELARASETYPQSN